MEGIKIRFYVLVGFVILPSVCFSQQVDPGTKHFAYDVVSVKESNPDPPNGGLTVRQDFLSADTLLRFLMQYAFGFMWDDQVSGLPKWAESTRYDVEAKIDEDTMKALSKLPTEERMARRREMCLQILTSRFGLKFHKEVRQTEVYDLVVAKGGPKLKKADAQATGSHSSMSRTKLTGAGMTLSDLANTLSRRLDRHLIDKTDLEGRYDFELTWPPDEGENPQSYDQQASLITALREQLGLRVVSSKAPMDMVVVDAISRPSEN